MSRLSVSVMLCMFMSRDVADAVLAGGRLVHETDVCSNVKTAACLDGNVSIHALQKYCQPPAWQALKHIAEQIQPNAVYYCPTCTLCVGDTRCVVCESCLQWYHFRCAALNSVPKAKLWFCRECKLQ